MGLNILALLGLLLVGTFLATAMIAVTLLLGSEIPDLWREIRGKRE